MGMMFKKEKAFESSIFKRKLSHFDKSDPNNLKLPQFLENIDDKLLYSLMPKIIENYKNKNYINLTREELEDKKEWTDMDILIVTKFYKNGWSFFIKEEENFFPHFVFTYNIKPLKEQIDKVIAHIYDKFDEESTKRILEDQHTYSALDMTYLLHYLTLTHPDYQEENEE